MKKIGLITIYHVPNFGSVLQTFATQEIIKKLGYECIVLKYRYPNEWHYIHGRKRPSVKNRIGQWMALSSGHRKANKLKKFRSIFLNYSRPFSNLEDLKAENWTQYHAIVAGSDQIWNARFTLADSAFMLSFLPEEIHRLSIASSFASNLLPESVRWKYQKFLSRFDAISVREKNGINIIREELGIKKTTLKVLLDPTLLLSRKEWLSLIPRSNFIKRKKYVLLYMLTYAFEPRPYIFEVLKYIQEKFDYEIIALEGYTSQKRASGLVMKDKTNSGIAEFIDMFANADMVVTSSFHGTAFAVNFGIPLISIIPNDCGDDRQCSLLKKLGLEQSIVPIGTDIHLINFSNKTNMEILEQERLDSLEWIQTQLHSYES